MIEVQPNEYQRADPEETLVTREVFTCLVVALRIRQAGVGYMGHFYAGESYDTTIMDVGEMADEAASEAGDPSLVSAWAAGCAALYGEREAALLRQELTGAVKGRGFKLVRELWLPSSDYAIKRAALDCPRASFTAPFVHVSRWRND
jgi:hypothetical protein